ncbi:ParB family protein [Litorihabitans aurantiacus]|uniref:ParB-like C-terminal domain-containing protein n=1 Tax=Litorihabitans aurantiacus TaxID=1930061 RepID=A0AA37XJ06_9MICO|nr:hypothetical protein [Litorihabitans aurantiacus]GMA33672.1 hypothetical protein GCM10025875_36640 [Litorihabitans aurantiacus]GMA33741.1 hypothetical protein GCM10025875_37330 [Litorihabitans aurantiacus]
MTSNRPTPRRSSLAGTSPVAPAPVETAPPTATAPPAPAVEATAPEAAPAGARPARRGSGGNKVSFYQPAEDAARMRAALLNTQAQTGVRGLSDFIARACLAEVERLEREYNAGQAWDPIGPGQIPTGRPMGE